jgi:hypothetical protein
MNIPTRRTLARLLAPWRTIRRLERRNKALSDTLANPALTGIAIHQNEATVGAAGPGPQIIAGMFLGLLQDHPEAVNYLQLTFGSSEGNILVTVQRPGGATPHNLRAMAEQEAREAKQEAEQLRAERDAAQEAVRRLMRWILEAYDSEVTRDVYHCATRDRMAGPLPPLPEWLVRQAGEGLSPTPAPPAPQPPIDGADLPAAG